MRIIISLSRSFLFLIGLILIGLLSACVDTTSPRPFYPNADQTLRRNKQGSLHLFVLSDWGFNGADGQRKVANEMVQISKLVGVNFIMTCGDNFQTAGVDSVKDPLWKINFEDVYNDSSLRVPWHPALGNHDYIKNPQAQVDYSAINPQWKMPARYYTFVEKINSSTTARFIVLDTQGLILDYQSLTDTLNYQAIKQYAWLKSLLQNSGDRWIIVTGHHPVYSASSYHGDTPEMKKLIKPLFDQYGVDFYICGHDHHFEYAKDKGKYTDYIVTGTGGYSRAAGTNEHTLYSMSSLGFTYLALNPDSAKLHFITADGLIGYSLTKKKVAGRGF